MGKKKTKKRIKNKKEKKGVKRLWVFSSVIGFFSFVFLLWVMTDYFPHRVLLRPNEWFIEISDGFEFIALLTCGCFALCCYKLIKAKGKIALFFFYCSLVLFAFSTIGWIGPDKVGEKSLTRMGRTYSWEDVHYVNVHWDGQYYYVIHFRNGKDMNVFMNNDCIPLLEKLDKYVRTKKIPVVIGNRPTKNDFEEESIGVQKTRIMQHIFYRYS